MFWTAVLAALLSGFPQGEPGQKAIMDVPEGEVASAMQSADLSQVAVAVYTPDGQKEVFLNGNSKGVFPEVWDLSFTSTGNLAFVAMDENDKMFFVLGSKKYGPYDYVGEFLLSDQGEHYAFKMGSGGEWTQDGYYQGGKYSVFYDGKKGKDYDFVSNITLSPDGKEVAYVARKGGKWDESGNYSGGKEFVVQGTKEHKKHGIAYNLAYSPDGKHLAYIVIDKGKWTDAGYTGGQSAVVLDGKVSKKKYPYVANMVFDSAGVPWYLASQGGKWTEDGYYAGGKYLVVSGDKEGRKYDFVKGLASTPEGRVFYIAGEGGRWEDRNYVAGDYYIVEGKRRKGPYDFVSPPLTSARGDYYACYVSQGGRWDPTGYYEGGKYFVVPNAGGISKEYENISSLAVGDERGFGFLGFEGGEWNEGSYQGGKVFGVWGRSESERYENIFPQSLNLSPKGRHLAFTAQNPETGQEFVVVDGVPLSDEFDFVFDRMLFSEDGKLLAFNGVKEGKIWLTIVEVGKDINKGNK